MSDTVTVDLSKQPKTRFVKCCMVCGGVVRELEPLMSVFDETHPMPEMCDKCKEAILKVRREIENSVRS